MARKKQASNNLLWILMVVVLAITGWQFFSSQGNRMKEYEQRALELYGTDSTQTPTEDATER